MSEMGRYCKAYLLKDLRSFSEWKENFKNVPHRENNTDEQAIDITSELTEESIVYIQENYVVTHGISKDENIIFDNVTSHWIEYCQQQLKFEVPGYSTTAQGG